VAIAVHVGYYYILRDAIPRQPSRIFLKEERTVGAIEDLEISVRVDQYLGTAIAVQVEHGR